MKVLVGSANRVKVEAVRKAFEGVFPDLEWDVQGIAVDSGVSEQPKSEQETILGARNRVLALQNHSRADYYVGIEGGLIRSADQWMECGWIIVRNNEGIEGIGASSKIMIPEAVYSYLTESGHTLNDVCKHFFNVKDAGKKMGYFGLMTNGMVDRSHAYIDAVAFALSRFAQPQVFETRSIDLDY